MKGHIFNIDNGYQEGLCRGFKNGILKQADYLNLVQCETLEASNAYFYKANIIMFSHISLDFRSEIAFAKHGLRQLFSQRAQPPAGVGH